MATSGTINLSGSSSSFKTRVVWSASQSTSSLKSTITYKVQYWRKGEVPTYSNYSGWIDFFVWGSKEESVSRTLQTVYMSVGESWTTVFSGSFTVSHTSSGQAPDITVSGYLNATGESYHWTIPEKTKINLSTIKVYASLSSASSFNDTENPKITYTVPRKSATTLLQACISLDGGKDDIAYRDIPIDSTSYTFELTEVEWAVLLNATLNGSASRQVRFYVKSTVSGSTYYKYLEKTFTVVDCMPEIHATVYDVNEKTVALTQNSDYFVIGASDLQFQVEATPKKGGTITGYNTICGSKNSTLQQDTFFQIEANEIVFTATDNRGQTATYTWPFETIEYVRPTCELELGELTIDDAGEATASVPVKISGTFFNSTFGEEGVLNEIVIEIKHTGTEDVWVEPPDGLVPIVEGENYKLEFTVQGLDYKKQLKFQARITDKATTVESVERTARIKPVFDWSDEDFNFNVPLQYQEKPMDFVIEYGSDSMGTNGTWYWQKWYSGKAECWGYRNYGNMAITKSFGELFVSEDFKQPLPSGLFGEPPYFISIEPMSGGYGTWVSKGYQDEATTDETMTFCLVRAKSNTLTQAKIGFHAIGSWMEPLG